VSTTVLLCALAVCLAGEVTKERKTMALPRWRDNSGMIFLRGGAFTRGGKHRVSVRSFYMDQCEVANEQFCAFLNDGNGKCWNAKQEIEKKGGRFVPKEGKGRWPVYCVSWGEAVAYARWAGKRLPTEAEWEYAAGGKEGRKYPWGNEALTPKRANFGGHVGHPVAVGSYPEGRTPDGICDLSGNVAEWCLDGFDPGYYAKAPEIDPTGPEEGERRVRRGGCHGMAAKDQECAARGSSPPDYRPKCIGLRCVRPARRVLLLLGENFEELEFAAFTGVLGWATHTRPEANGTMRKADEAVPVIEVVIAGFDREVHSMGSMTIRPDVLVRDLKDEDVDRLDAVAIPACVGTGRGQHTGKGQEDLVSKRTLAIVRRVHAAGGVIATGCWAEAVLKAAKLPHNPGYTNYPTYTRDKDGAFNPLPFDPKQRSITTGGPLVATEAACLLLKQLVGGREYRIFRRHNPWLFGIKDEFPPRLDAVK